MTGISRGIERKIRRRDRPEVWKEDDWTQYVDKSGDGMIGAREIYRHFMYTMSISERSSMSNPDVVKTYILPI